MAPAMQDRGDGSDEQRDGPNKQRASPETSIQHKGDKRHEWCALAEIAMQYEDDEPDEQSAASEPVRYEGDDSDEQRAASEVAKGYEGDNSDERYETSENESPVQFQTGETPMQYEVDEPDKRDAELNERDAEAWTSMQYEGDESGKQFDESQLRAAAEILMKLHNDECPRQRAASKAPVQYVNDESEQDDETESDESHKQRAAGKAPMQYESDDFDELDDETEEFLLKHQWLFTLPELHAFRNAQLARATGVRPSGEVTHWLLRKAKLANIAATGTGTMPANASAMPMTGLIQSAPQLSIFPIPPIPLPDYWNRDPAAVQDEQVAPAASDPLQGSEGEAVSISSSLASAAAVGGRTNAPNQVSAQPSGPEIINISSGRGIMGREEHEGEPSNGSRGGMDAAIRKREPLEDDDESDDAQSSMRQMPKF